MKRFGAAYLEDGYALPSRKVTVPARLQGMDFDALCAEAEKHGAAGVEIVRRERELLAAASCSPCQRNRSAAALRVWIVEEGEK